MMQEKLENVKSEDVGNVKMTFKRYYDRLSKISDNIFFRTFQVCLMYYTY